MATSTQSNGSKKASRSKSASKKTSKTKSTAKRKTASDAVALLEKQHREVEALFSKFEKAKDDEAKGEIFAEIAKNLKMHTTIEEEIFYPESRRCLEDEDIVDEAEVEHDAAKKLMAEIEAMQPGDDYYDAKVTVLKEMIEHHVEEEEEEYFPKCEKSEMDLVAVGEQMKARAEELKAKLGLEPAN